jgi:hypothetical protein
LELTKCRFLQAEWNQELLHQLLVPELVQNNDCAKTELDALLELGIFSRAQKIDYKDVWDPVVDSLRVFLANEGRHGLGFIQD